MTIEAGALALRISEIGGDQVLAKLTQIDAKAKAIGQATQSVKFNAPSATVVAGQIQQVSRAQMQLGQALAATTPAIAQNTRAHQQLGQAVGAGEIVYSKYGQSQQRVRSQTDGLTASLLRQVGAYFTFRAVVGVYDAIAGAADRQDTALRKLSATSRLTGESLATITAISTSAQDKFRVSSSVAADLTQNFVKLASRAGNVAQTGQLMSAWMDLAKAQGLSLSDVMTGINSTLVGQDEGLNRLGLANPSNIWKKWADAAGTTVAKMTEQQKWQSIVNEVTQQGAKVLGEYGRFLESTQGKQEAFSSALERTAASFGKSLAPAREWFYEVGTGLLNVIRLVNNMDDTFAGMPAKFSILGHLFSGNFAAASAELIAAGDKRPFMPQGPPAPKPVDAAAAAAAEKARQEAAKKAEEERQKAIEQNIGALVTLAEAHKLTSADMLKAIAIDQQLSAEYDKGTASLQRRAEIVKQLGQLSGIIIARPELTLGIPDGTSTKPQLVGVDEAGKMKGEPVPDDPLEKQRKKLEENTKKWGPIVQGLGQSVGSAFGDGFDSAFTEGGNFFEAFGTSLLRSLGNIMVQLGAQMLAYGLIIAPLAALLAFTPFGGLGLGAGASIAAGLALVALGSVIGGSGSKGGSSGSGSGRSGPPQAQQDNQWEVAFDPDRKLRKAKAAVMPSSRALGNAPMPEARPVQMIHVTTFGRFDAYQERQLAEAVKSAASRGIINLPARR